MINDVSMIDKKSIKKGLFKVICKSVQQRFRCQLLQYLAGILSVNAKQNDIAENFKFLWVKRLNFTLYTISGAILLTKTLYIKTSQKSFFLDLGCNIDILYSKMNRQKASLRYQRSS